MNLKEYDLVIVAQNSCLPTHQRFLHEAKKMGVRAGVLNLENYCFTIPARSNKNYLPAKAKWALHRTMGVNFDEFDLRVASYLENQHFRISNPLPLLTALRDKVAQLQALHGWGAPVIPSLLVRGDIEGNNLSSIQSFIRQTKHARFILKTERGNRGLGVSLVNGVDSLYSWLTTLRATRDQRFILQPFIEDAREYRVLICGTECLGVVEKQRKSQADHNFKHNAKHTHFTALKLQSPKASPMLAWAKELQEKMQSDFLAIDFLLTKKTLSVLEIGLCPGFSEFEHACKVNVAGKVLKNLFKN
ncbi:MAG: hypothetical protein A2X86_11495 [Bdellovibrionales bacterium GWA2_49_15]|nr:MAG: hypothetical protein A2X86_11495 [Bdellovibrionales bacterium GWA2_49_15]